jgi:hypothetical protein
MTRKKKRTKSRKRKNRRETREEGRGHTCRKYFLHGALLRQFPGFGHNFSQKMAVNLYDSCANQLHHDSNSPFREYLFVLRRVRHTEP